jgi:4a-hydroxytetrahydrobiopterin dehydratase
MDAAQARQLASAIPGWELTEDVTRIRRKLTFASFPAAIEFVERVAGVAEDEGHHPDFHISYRDVDVVLYTHVIGGLHENDFIVAAKINELVGDSGQG